MKKQILQIITMLFMGGGLMAQVGINTTTPDTTAALDISSTAKGLLIPRMTKAQRDAIGMPGVPATGLQIYQTDNTPGFYYYNGTGWVALSGGGGASELQKITEGSNIGWRILGREPANYGNIGSGAIDLSFSSDGSTTAGATGQNSTAMGVATTASGFMSTAMGVGNIASGTLSTAMGNGTTASGTVSTAMGSGTTASGANSTAMGIGTSASGHSSTAMGEYSTASGFYSTAMGTYTTASGQSSTAIGNGTNATGRSSTAMGLATTAKSFAEIALGAYNTDYTPESATAFNAADRAFGVGIGTGEGANAKDGLIVYKDGTLWLDTLTAAPTPTANRLYVLNKKLHYNGVEVGGGGGGASELQKITEGGNTGWRILGRDALNYGNIGNNAMDFSFSNGFNGSLAGATGGFSSAMGYNTTAFGQSSTAMGYFTTASDFYSTALGNNTKALGIGSTAMGEYTTASARSSTAMGNETIAKSVGELAIGHYNDTLTTVNATNFFNDAKRIFTVGNGSITLRKTAFVIQQNGRIGIGTGTNAVTKGLVQIDGFVDYIPNQQTGYLNGSGATGFFNTGSTNNIPYSIWASHRIAANEFNAFSDKRIKNVIGVSSNINDLNTLAQIRITDYTMKDKVQYGDKSYKKVIAQELKEVYPQAVNMSSNTIPNIYQKATISDGWIALETDLVKGDIVKIITANGNKEIAVDEVEKGRFKVAMADAEVFVYGKQVSDFHTVDYEALTTLNISATQALLKRIEELEVSNKNLTAQLNQITDLKNDIEAIKAQLGNAVKSTASANK